MNHLQSIEMNNFIKKAARPHDYINIFYNICIGAVAQRANGQSQSEHQIDDLCSTPQKRVPTAWNGFARRAAAPCHRKLFCTASRFSAGGSSFQTDTYGLLRQGHGLAAAASNVCSVLAMLSGLCASTPLAQPSLCPTPKLASVRAACLRPGMALS